jgi:hypothetical protein
VVFACYDNGVDTPTQPPATPIVDSKKTKKWTRIILLIIAATLLIAFLRYILLSIVLPLAFVGVTTSLTGCPAWVDREYHLEGVYISIPGFPDVQAQVHCNNGLGSGNHWFGIASKKIATNVGEYNFFQWQVNPDHDHRVDLGKEGDISYVVIPFHVSLSPEHYVGSNFLWPGTYVPETFVPVPYYRGLYAGLFSYSGKGKLKYLSAFKLVDFLSGDDILKPWSTKKMASTTIIVFGENGKPLQYVSLIRDGNQLKLVDTGLQVLPDFTVKPIIYRVPGEQNLPTTPKLNFNTNEKVKLKVELENLGSPTTSSYSNSIFRSPSASSYVNSIDSINLKIVAISESGIETILFDNLIGSHREDWVNSEVLTPDITTTLKEPGTYKMLVEVNPNHTIQESDYTNNSFEAPLIITSHDNQISI